MELVAKHEVKQARFREALHSLYTVQKAVLVRLIVKAAENIYCEIATRVLTSIRKCARLHQSSLSLLLSFTELGKDSDVPFPGTTYYKYLQFFMRFLLVSPAYITRNICACVCCT